MECKCDTAGGTVGSAAANSSAAATANSSCQSTSHDSDTTDALSRPETPSASSATQDCSPMTESTFQQISLAKQVEHILRRQFSPRERVIYEVKRACHIFKHAVTQSLTRRRIPGIPFIADNSDARLGAEQDEEAPGLYSLLASTVVEPTNEHAFMECADPRLSPPNLESPSEAWPAGSVSESFYQPLTPEYYSASSNSLSSNDSASSTASSIDVESTKLSANTCMHYAEEQRHNNLEFACPELRLAGALSSPLTQIIFATALKTELPHLSDPKDVRLKSAAVPAVSLDVLTVEEWLNHTGAAFFASPEKEEDSLQRKLVSERSLNCTLDRKVRELESIVSRLTGELYGLREGTGGGKKGSSPKNTEANLH